MNPVALTHLARIGALAALAAWLGCNAIIGLELGEPEAAGSEGGASNSSSTTGAPAGSGASGGAPTGGAGGVAGGAGTSSGGAGGALECWGPDTICCAETTPCPTATMECCLTNVTSGESATCVAKDTCPTLAAQCDDSEDCPGAICCITFEDGKYQRVQCEATCTPPNVPGNPGKYPMCNLDGGTCPGNLVCYVDDYLGEVGWGYCFNP